MTHEKLCPMMGGPCHSVGGVDQWHDRGSVDCRCGVMCECKKIRKIQAATRKEIAARNAEEEDKRIEEAVQRGRMEMVTLLRFSLGEHRHLADHLDAEPGDYFNALDDVDAMLGRLAAQFDIKGK